MSGDGLFARSLVGRFYRLKQPIERNTSLLKIADPHAWEKGREVGRSFYRGLCDGDPPYEGDLGASDIELAYDDGGSGIWRLWIREEERSVSRKQIESRATVLARADDPDTPLKKRQRSNQVFLKSQARADLLQEATPKLRVVPVLLTQEWAWIGRRASVDDLAYGLLLGRLVGSVQPDPIVWAPDGDLGWSAASMAVLFAFLESESTNLAPDVMLCKLDARGHSLSCKATDDIETVREVLREFTQNTGSVLIRALSFEVYQGGDSILVEVDRHGVFRVIPSRSRGGLPAERIKRRFDDALCAARRVGEVMKEWHERIVKSEADGE